MTKLLEISIASGRLNYRLTDYEGHYGLDVECTLFEKLDRVVINDITTDMALAQKLLYLVAENAVLPANLADIVLDFISEEYSIAC